MNCLFKPCWNFILLLLVGFVFAGCNRNDGGNNSASFDNAPPQIKATWDKAVAADKINDYVVAIVAYRQILQQQDKLQPAQVRLVEDASSQLFQRLVAASTQGDPAARQALVALRQMNQPVSH
jgi:hypothetical protein